MKKINLFILLLISIFTLSVANIYSVDQATEIGGARYLVDQVAEVNMLPYGVVHTRELGFTSTSMSNYDADGLGGGTAIVVPDQYYPQQVNVLEVPTSETVRVTSWANLNGHRWTLSTVKGMIYDYEAHNPGWKVVAAINGDFFDIGGTGNLPYQTSGAHGSNGEFYKTSTGRLVGFTNDGSVNSLIGNEKVDRTEFMLLAVYDENGAIIAQFNVEQINSAPNANETSVYFANYNSEKQIVPVAVNVGTSNGYFVDNASLALPNRPTDFYGKGEISSTESKTISIGQFAIVTNNPDVNNALAIGVQIRVQYEYTGAYANTKDFTGGGATIMKNSEVNLSAGMANRAPRTVIGKKADGTIVMMVVDGRQAGKGMFGADHTELAAIMKSYDCVEAYNLDGGGSSTLVIRRDGQLVVMNSPSDGQERTDANALLIVVKEPELKNEITSIEEDNVTFNIEVLKNNGHDIKEMLIEMNGELKTLTDGHVTFSDLDFNTEYPYSLYYRDNNNELTKIIQDGRIKTLKRVPYFIKLDIVETVSHFEITIIYYDPDLASNIHISRLQIDSRFATFRLATMSVPKSIVGDTIGNFVVRFTYDLNDKNNISVTIDNPEFTLRNSIEIFLINLMKNQNDTVVGIYK